MAPAAAGACPVTLCFGSGCAAAVAAFLSLYLTRPSHCRERAAGEARARVRGRPDRPPRRHSPCSRQLRAMWNPDAALPCIRRRRGAREGKGAVCASGPPTVIMRQLRVWRARPADGKCAGAPAFVCRVETVACGQCATPRRLHPTAPGAAVCRKESCARLGRQDRQKRLS
eukprot:159701-Chlamydomonas_euryale.AAC.6